MGHVAPLFLLEKHMKTQLMSAVSMGSGIAGWVKATAIAMTLVGTIFVSHQRLNSVDIASTIHSEQIQDLRESAIKYDSRIQILENDRDRQDKFNDKMMETLNSLNISIERLNTTIELLQKQKGS